ncbi:hypothetical protein F511_02648 [Dorcoceras hygrometricum]|uniref:Uncharacterized protein n=1 Tax=Dorcoceras hygrometricum TaxID=472368 RepID=A0A2Z7D4R2_9LAMI|nr:hypothetical protein F511_02648 [Dorcoceras hygrometricum]
MSLFDLQDVCIAIGSLATLDLPMVVDLIGIYGLKGPYCTLTMTNWFLQALSVIPRGSWGDVARRSYHDPVGQVRNCDSGATMVVGPRLAIIVFSFGNRVDRSDLIGDRIYDEVTMHLLSLDIKSSQKQLSAQTATAAIDFVDVRREVKELNAKVTYLDGQVAATRNDLLEFRAKAQESLNHITDQLSELVNYINRGGNDKKGEYSSSQGSQRPPDDHGIGSGNTGGDNVRTTDIVDRFSGSMSREGRGRGRSGERCSSGNRSGHSKRRRYDSGGPFRRPFEDWLG